MRRAKKSAVPQTIDDYLAPLPLDQRKALLGLRRQIHAAVPGLVESISYRIPSFKLEGRQLVYFAAFTKHCSLFVGHLATSKQFAKALAKYELRTGTIRFDPKKPMPAPLVKKLVRARLAQVRARFG